MLSTNEDIDNFGSTLNTGDIILMTSGKYYSIVSFAICAACNSSWTHSGMIIKAPDGTTQIWESVNNHRSYSIYTDYRTKKPAVGDGVRLIDFTMYLKGCLKSMPEGKQETKAIGVLRLDRNLVTNEKLRMEIEDYVLKRSVHLKMNYPKDMEPLIRTWWDGWQSCFVPCGFYTTYEAQLANLDPNAKNTPLIHKHYKHRLESGTEDVICSQLVIKTLEETNYFKSQIPCDEWTVDDLTEGKKLNIWMVRSSVDLSVGYENQLDIKYLYKW